VGAATILVLSIAAVDSLNPSTVAPVALLAFSERPLRRILAFTLGVFLVSTAGGLVLLFGLGRAWLTQLAHPSHHTRHLLELCAGVALLMLAALLWANRERLRRRLGESTVIGGRSAFLVGAAIMAVELPTAFPYFAAILVILGSVHRRVGEASLLLLYNVVFAAPLLAVLGLAALGRRSRAHVAGIARFLQTRGPVVAPVGVAVIGSALVVTGWVGL
jgi:cytochrome c biogenesis protein CcdA